MLLAQSRAQHLRRQSSNSQEAVDSEQCLSFCLSVLDGKVLFFFLSGGRYDVYTVQPAGPAACSQ